MTGAPPVNVKMTSFTPDYEAQFSISMTVTDNCPSAASRSTAFSVATPVTFETAQCQLKSTGISLAVNTTFTNNTMIPGGVSRNWVDKVQRFGDAWRYTGGMATPTMYTPTLLSGAASNDILCGTFSGAPTTCVGGAGSTSVTLTTTPAAATFALYRPRVAFSVANGATLVLDASAPLIAPGSVGAELRIGCITAGVGITDPYSTLITYFRTVLAADGLTNNAALSPPGAYITLPPSCVSAGNINLVFFVPLSLTPTTYTLTNPQVCARARCVLLLAFCCLMSRCLTLAAVCVRALQVLIHPNGFPYATPSCFLAYTYPMQSGGGLAANGGSAMATTIVTNQVTASPAIVGGAIASTQVLFELNELPRPAWLAPLTCPSIKSTSGPALSLTCPVYTLDWAPVADGACALPAAACCAAC
jgi:hypothetical protein